MKYAARLAMIFAAGLWALVAPQAYAGPGGGHGGGGHSGGGHGSGGHSSGGHSSHGSSRSASGHGASHSIGHSIGRIFGRHGKNGSQPAVNREMAAQPSASIIPVHPLHPQRRRPRPVFVSGPPFIFFPHQRAFGFGGCPEFRWTWSNFFWGNDFDCFNSGFFFDPFLFGGFYSWYWSGSPTYASGPFDPMEAPAPAPPDGPDNAAVSSSVNEGKDAESQPKPEAPPTLMQLRDGSMYGLTDYWVEGHELHYVTTYGGENSVPIDHIDLEKTAQLNAGRGVELVLRPKPAAPH